jgi:hypothetical protein
VQTTTECPHCGAERPELAPRRPPIGPPFEECTACGRFIPRPTFNEWALHRTSVRLGLLSRAALRVLLFGALPVLFYAGFNLSGGSPVDPLTALVAAVLGLGAAAAWVSTSTVGQINRSRRRMTDPMYLAKLAEFARSSTGPVLDQTKLT